jgi:GDPmannose 4,6-dehydratase
VSFSAFGLDWINHVEQTEELFRPTDLLMSRADPSNAEQDLGWKARCKMPDVVMSMLEPIRKK